MPLSAEQLISLNFPFGGAAGRSQARLLFDLAIGIAAFDESQKNRKVLDFACGTGWTSEWLNRFGYDVYAFDVDPAAIHMADLRPPTDPRIELSRFHTSVGDGHSLGFPASTFGHIFCFDSLHHMRDYRIVFQEMNRVLVPGGRAIFIEPGSRHSTSPETIKFLKEHQFGDWWLEKDVDLLQIAKLGRETGFCDMRVKPFLLPYLGDFSFTDWYNILDNPPAIANYMRELRRFTYEDRVIFCLTKSG
jgi:SAM-dependent methyltransferase